MFREILKGAKTNRERVDALAKFEATPFFPFTAERFAEIHGDSSCGDFKRLKERAIKEYKAQLKKATKALNSEKAK